MTTPQPVPAWPRYRLTAAADGAVTVTGPAADPGPHPDRPAAVSAVATIAATLAPPRPVLADAVDADGTVWPLTISPDGTVQEAGPALKTKPKKARPTTAVQEPSRPKLRRRWRRSRAPHPAVPAPATEQPTAAVPAQPAGPFVIPTLPTTDNPTVAVRRGRIPRADEPTVRVRPRRAVPPAEQHERPADQPPALHPVAPTGLTAPAPRTSGTPDSGDPEPIPSAFRIRTLAESGRLQEAAQMAAALDEAAARTHGPSHRASLEAREIRAHIAAELGDLATAVHLYRDAAERHAFQNDTAAAEEAAGRAHALWLRIDDPAQAITTGETVVAMRSNIPGQGGIAYRHAVKHLAKLRTRTQHDHTTAR